MNAIELLDAMDKILDEPKKWTKGEYAQDHDGVGTYATDPEAVCWCMSGAMNKAVGGDSGTATVAEYFAINAIRLAAKELYGEEYFAIANFNDAPSTDYIRVKAVISRARQLLKSHQKEENA